MRIIGGEAGGRRLRSPDGLTTRPMTDRTREAIFNILAWDIGDADVLDLYAGAGGMGLEALSRNAASAAFVELDRSTAAVLQENIGLVGLGGNLVVSDVERYLGRAAETFDIVFVDPPYPLALDEVSSVLHKIAPVLRDNGLVLLHRHKGEEVPEAPWPLVDERRYGAAQLWFFRSGGQA
jgi:16S rRNA (guanine966-N2)-methyltransferase